MNKPLKPQVVFLLGLIMIVHFRLLTAYELWQIIFRYHRFKV